MYKNIVTINSLYEEYTPLKKNSCFRINILHVTEEAKRTPLTAYNKHVLTLTGGKTTKKVRSTLLFEGCL